MPFSSNNALITFICFSFHFVYLLLFSHRLFLFTYISKDRWITFQRRLDGSVNFYRNWTDYENGFGNIDGEFWLGLSQIHKHTSTGNWSLRIELEDFEGSTRYAEYEIFAVADSCDNYLLSVSGYSGNAGDAMGYNNSRGFTTKDRSQVSQCAVSYRGAWWYYGCTYANLNGLYVGSPDLNERYKGIILSKWKGFEFLKTSLMKMCRIN